MPEPRPNNQRLIFGSLVFALGALCLLINMAGVARLAYDIVVLGAPTNLLAKVLILSLVFVFGLGLGLLSQRRFENSAFPLFAQVYTVVYLAVTCVTYLGITLRISDHNYSLLLYGAFAFIIALELITALAMRLVVPAQTYGVFAIPLLAIVLFHLFLIVYQYIFASAPLSVYLLGDLFFLLTMTVVSSALLGQNAFRAVIERVIEKVG